MKRKKYLSIKAVFFLCMLFFILLMVVLVDVTVMTEYRRDITTKVLAFDQEIVSELGTNMEANVVSLEENIYYKLWDCGVILHSEEAPGRNFSVERQLRAFTALMRSSGFQVYGVFWQNTQAQEYYYAVPGSTFSSQDAFSGSAAYRYLDKNNAYLQNNRGTTFWRSFSDAEERLFLMKAVLDPETCQYKGILCIEMDPCFFSEMEKDLSCRTAVYDEQGILIYGNQDLLLQRGRTALQQIDTAQFEEDFSVQASIGRKGWTLIAFESRQKVLASMYHLLKQILLYEVLLAGLAAGLAAVISGGITSNIREISRMFQRIEEGKEPVHIPIRSSDETAYLCEKFNDMSDKLQDSIRQQTYENTQREKAEYNALIAQMNPHFLYNTLEAINSLAKLRGQGEIVLAIDQLSRLLRISLSGEKQEVPLEEELQYEESYLQLQKMMGGNRLNWDILAEPELKQCRVPKLILQPIIENAILHGIDGMVADAMIVIVCQKDQGRLLLEVSDNGRGMDSDTLNRLLSEDEPTPQLEDRTHIGIRGIQRRIRQLYGPEYGLSITSDSGSGTVVSVALPLLAREE